MPHSHTHLFSFFANRRWTPAPFVCVLALVPLLLVFARSAIAAEDGRLEAYQIRMMEKGPQERAGEEGLDVLTLLPEISEPKIETTIDPRTGKAVLPLTIEEVLVWTLANSPQITVVSYNPEISKQDITRAESQFDYTTFGSANYDRDNVPNNNVATDSSSVRSHSSTGAKRARWKAASGKRPLLAANGPLPGPAHETGII